jgi:hypothetical protein
VSREVAAPRIARIEPVLRTERLPPQPESRKDRFGIVALAAKSDPVAHATRIRRNVRRFSTLEHDGFVGFRV